MMRLTLPETNQIFGSQGVLDKNALSIFEKYGTMAAITDFTILLGGYVSDYFLNGSIQLKDRIGWYWTKTDYNKTDMCTIDLIGTNFWFNVSKRNGGCRPALPFSSISKVASIAVRGNHGVL